MASAADQNPTGHAHAGEGETRRDFLLIATTTFGAVGTLAALWPFIHQMNPARDVLALRTTEVDLSAIKPGERILVKWQGKPVFIEHRTTETVQLLQNDSVVGLPDPELDSARTKKPEWLVVVGVCTHLGCIPLGQKPGEERGAFGGWFCPCHGSVYDRSGRIRQGPAPTNLLVPPYEFLPDDKLLIG
jgi:ubiquinol-cytochrome c reductase iron-sulfur subunit